LARETELEQIVAERTTELRRANELKSRFLVNISHEFRTPLTLTFGPIDDLLSGRYHVEEAARPPPSKAPGETAVASSA
jgi:signal transduction histidine kinase